MGRHKKNVIAPDNVVTLERGTTYINVTPVDVTPVDVTPPAQRNTFETIAVVTLSNIAMSVVEMPSARIAAAHALYELTDGTMITDEMLSSLKHIILTTSGTARVDAATLLLRIATKQ